MNVLKKPPADTRLTETVDDLLAQSRIIEGFLQSLHRQNAQFVELTKIMKATETAIDGAIAGRAPNATDWGRLSAPDFLRIVQDITTWSLTNFEAFKSRPPSEKVPTDTSLWETPYYKLSYRYQPPFDSELPLRTLASVNAPELRCPALWWAHALISAAHPVKDPRHCSPQARQQAFLRRRCPNGLHWLLEQMAHWPEAHVRERWFPLDQLL